MYNPISGENRSVSFDSEKTGNGYSTLMGPALNILAGSIHIATSYYWHLTTFITRLFFPFWKYPNMLLPMEHIVRESVCLFLIHDRIHQKYVIRSLTWVAKTNDAMEIVWDGHNRTASVTMPTPSPRELNTMDAMGSLWQVNWGCCERHNHFGKEKN